MYCQTLFDCDVPSVLLQSCPWVGSTHVLGWVGLGHGSETFPKILKRGGPPVTAEVIPDYLIMINTDK